MQEVTLEPQKMQVARQDWQENRAVKETLKAGLMGYWQLAWSQSQPGALDLLLDLQLVKLGGHGSHDPWHRRLDHGTCAPWCSSRVCTPLDCCS